MWSHLIPLGIINPQGAAPAPDEVVGGHFWEYWQRQYLKMWEYKTPTKKEIVEAIKDEPQKAIEAIPEVKREFVREFGEVDYSGLAQNLRMQQFLAQQILIALQSRARQLDEEDAEFLLLM